MEFKPPDSGQNEIKKLQQPLNLDRFKDKPTCQVGITSSLTRSVSVVRKKRDNQVRTIIPVNKKQSEHALQIIQNPASQVVDGLRIGYIVGLTAIISGVISHYVTKLMLNLTT